MSSGQRVTWLTLFLTFGVIALHQARLSDLYVEGFVLLILLIVDYFHLDGFTEEEEGEGEKRGEGREVRKGQAGNWKTGNEGTALGFPTSSGNPAEVVLIKMLPIKVKVKKKLPRLN